MAGTSFGVNHPLAVKLWSRKLFHEALKNTEMSAFIGEGADSMIQILSDTGKSAGDRVTVGLRMQLTGSGVQGDGTLEGNEEALVTYSDNVFIDQLRHAVRSAGKMSEQRIPWSVREEARMGLTDWWKDRIDTWIVNQLTGYTAQTDTRYTGNQAAIAPSTGRIIYGTLAAQETAEASISTTATMNLTVIDKAVATAKTATPMVRPLGKPAYDYVLFVHPYQTYSLRQSVLNGTSGPATWSDITRAEVQGGGENRFKSGKIGIYNRTLIVENSRMPSFTTTAGGANTGRRAVFCGAQAAAMCVGRDTSPERMSWVEELFDYKNQLGVSAGMVAGVKKLQFNSTDFGSIVISTYAAAP